MQIIKGSITSLASEGRITLQVPTMAIGIGTAPSVSFETVPDDWFVYLRNDVPATGKQEGFLFLSKRGFDANKTDIQRAFLSSTRARGTWADFEKHAEEHFKKVETKTKKRIEKLKKELVELEKAIS